MPLAAPRPPSRRFANALARAALHTLVALAGTANAQVSGAPELFASSRRTLVPSASTISRFVPPRVGTALGEIGSCFMHAAV